MMAQMNEGVEDKALDAPASPLTVLLVCTGNICRSPMAEVVLRDACARHELGDARQLGDAVVVESAGTSNWHEGSSMDPRARLALDVAGFFGHGTSATQVTAEQLASCDFVVALDRGHRADLHRLAPTSEVSLLRWWSEGIDLDVPDPYYGDAGDFASCLDLIVPGCRALAQVLSDRLA
jgi:protein-tyrosine phosphatase